MNDGNNSQLKPASECIWYVLATIAGEPGESPNPQRTAEQNRYYWNGMMKGRGFDDEGRSPTLTPEDTTEIHNALFHRGFTAGHIPQTNEPIDFSYVDFPDQASFDGFVFGGTTYFKAARFGGDSHSLRDARFRGPVSFESAEFCGDLIGQSNVFTGSVNFINAKFRGTVSFESSAFRGVLEFDKAKCLHHASFRLCRFLRYASFVDTEFYDHAIFNQAHFQGEARFQRAKFKGSVPNFSEAELPAYTEWHDTEWPRFPKDTSEALIHIQRYECLARLMNGLEKFNDQRMFVRLEMRARRRVDGWSPAGLMNLGYEAICGYGYGLTRVLIIWVAHIALGILALCAAKVLKSPDEVTLWQATRDAFADAHVAFALSFANAHGPLGLGRTFFDELSNDWPWQQVIGPVQTVLGVILLFLLLLTIRNRFRMR